MTSTSGGRGLTVVAWAFAWFLIIVVGVFVVVRLTSDLENLSSGAALPEADFDKRYAENPVLAYLHIIPGVIYLLGAPFQFSQRLRSGSLRRHRRLGLVVLGSGLVTGAMALAVGIIMPFGGLAEASASVVFGIYFITSLLLAYRAIKSGDEATHRRWMIRAFCVGVAVGMIRIVVGAGEAFGIGIADSFGAAFWIAFVVMTVLGEIWLRLRPDPPRLVAGIAVG